ncbi:unnamed protein product [Paramecium primaurelia]|uniref:Rieske domain-containing protein n=1 Tax=Paramecium primaurelia TaxID=5886 RepID=A0A8S1L4D6_PARPR|nr:unnamed protein product [Paramecium primaurelia]
MRKILSSAIAISLRRTPLVVPKRTQRLAATLISLPLIRYGFQTLNLNDAYEVSIEDNLTEGEMREVQVGPKKEDAVLVCKVDGQIYCVSNSCPHVGAPLSAGFLVGDKVKCPFHNASFSVKDGAHEEGPMFRGLQTFPVKQENGQLVIRVEKSLLNAPRTLNMVTKGDDPTHVVIVGGGCMTLLGDQYVASGGKDRNIKVYKQTYTNNVFEKLQLSMSLSDAHPTEVTSLAYGGGNILYSSSASGELKVWDFMDGTLIKQVKNYAGWCFRIINFQIEEEQTPQQKTQLQTSIPLCGSPRRKKQTQNEYECIKNCFIGTVSFDGTFKVFNGKTLLNDNPQPMITTQLKSLHDCHPFGGVLAIRDSITDKIDILSSGNKNDCNIQLYSLAQS